MPRSGHVFRPSSFWRGAVSRRTFPPSAGGAPPGGGGADPWGPPPGVAPQPVDVRPLPGKHVPQGHGGGRRGIDPPSGREVLLPFLLVPFRPLLARREPDDRDERREYKGHEEGNDPTPPSRRRSAGRSHGAPGREYNTYGRNSGAAAAQS